MVSARQPGLRAISALIYSAIYPQVYNDVSMVKNLPPEKVIQLLCDEVLCFDLIACMDVSSFDSAQRGVIFEIEKYLFEKIVGKEWAEVWCSIAQNPNFIKSGNGIVSLTLQ